MEERRKSIAVPAAVTRFLDSTSDALINRKIDRIRLAPLILRAPVESLLARRKRLFDFVSHEAREFGFEVSFRRRLKKTREHPEGRECVGVFNILVVNGRIGVIASTLSEDDHKHGPVRFADCAYPLADRPFFSSTFLVRLIDKFGLEHKCAPMTLNTLGYHRKTRSYRRDQEQQSPGSAAREMAEQDRYPHRMTISFRSERREKSRLTFDRNSRLTILKGNTTTAVKELMLPGVLATLETEKIYEIKRAENSTQQEIVELNFRDAPFDSYSSMVSLCDAVRKGDGLNVSVIHLNPYLQAQVLDFYTGAAVELLIMDKYNVALIPRAGNCKATIQRIATTVYRHFGEGDSLRARIIDEKQDVQ